MDLPAPAYQIRQACRRNAISCFPSLAAPGFLCVNLVMLDEEFAAGFEAFCRANPVPCPLLGVLPAGETAAPDLGRDIDVRTDLRSYDVIENGRFIGSRSDVIELFTSRTVSFLIGSSVSLDGLLVSKGWTPSFGPCIYRTNVDCIGVGPFQGKMAVTMRSYPPAIAEEVAEYTAHFPSCHGGPVSRDPAPLGITNEQDFLLPFPGWVPAGHQKLYWGCGVTPSLVVQNAALPRVIVHTPGNALVTDIRTDNLFEPL